MGLTVMDRKKDGTPKERNRCRYWKITVELKPEVSHCTSNASAESSAAPSHHSPTRRRRTKSEYFRGTESEARIREAELKVQLNRCSHSDIELEPLAREWLETRKSKVENTTYRNLLALVNTLARIFPHTRVQDIDVPEIEQALADFKFSRNPKPFSEAYISNLVSLLEQVLNYAKRAGIVEKVVTEYMDKPSRRNKKEPSVPKIDEIYNLIVKLDAKDRNECCVLLSATMGLRVGEALGCKWKDVDFENQTIHIRRNMRHDGTLADRTKTASGDRILPMTGFIVGLLKERRRHLEQQLDGIPDVDELTICAKSDGSPTTTSSQTHWWHKNRDRLGMAGCTFHSLRHGYLSALASVGRTPIEMMRLAGHSSAQITLEIYTHINMKEKTEAAESLVSKLYPEEYENPSPTLGSAA